MRSFKYINLVYISVFLMPLFCACKSKTNKEKNENFISFTTNPQTQNIKLYWKNDSGQILKSIGNLKTWLSSKNKKLLFAMNGGM